MLVRLLTLLTVAATFITKAAAPSQWEWIYPTPHHQSWSELTAGPNGFVGITEGEGGRHIFHSANGAEWEVATSPTNSRLRSVVFANGNYIAVGDYHTVLSSPDGLDWQLRHTDPAGPPLFDVASGNDVYVAVGYNSTALFSKDLKTWTPLEFPKGYSLVNVEFGNGL